MLLALTCIFSIDGCISQGSLEEKSQQNEYLSPQGIYYVTCTIGAGQSRTAACVLRTHSELLRPQRWMTQQSQTDADGVEDSWGVGGGALTVSPCWKAGGRNSKCIHSAARNKSGQAKAVLLFFG